MPSTATASAGPTRGPHDRSTDPLARLATTLIGGPRGRYAAPPQNPGRHRLLIGALLSFGACVTLAVGFLQKSHCVRHGWGAPEAYWKACYSDLPTFASQTALLAGRVPYGSGEAIAQPVGTGLLLWVLSFFVPAEGIARQQGFFIAWTFAAAICLIVIVCALVWTLRSRPELAAHVALSPVVVLVALVAPDLFAIALTVVAVWAWSRERPVAAGLALGLAMTTRTLPVLLLVVLGGLAVRAGVGHLWARMAGTALITAVAVIGAVTMVTDTSTLSAYQAWLNAGAELGSPWYLASLAMRPIPDGVLLVLVVVGWVLAITVGLLLAFAADSRPRVGEVALVVVLLVLMTGKALPVQAALWVLPFLALARLPLRDHAVWASTEVVSFVAVWLYLGGLHDPVTALPTAWYAFFVVVRLFGMSWLVVATIRQIRSRRGVDLDEAAGPISRHHDAVVIRYTGRADRRPTARASLTIRADGPGGPVDGLPETSPRPVR